MRQGVRIVVLACAHKYCSTDWDDWLKMQARLGVVAQKYHTRTPHTRMCGPFPLITFRELIGTHFQLSCVQVLHELPAGRVPVPNARLFTE
jgi:hypothetical protein